MIRVKLKVLSGSNAGKVVRISKDEFFIGRSKSCHLRPSSDTISRKHCVLRIEGEIVSIEDLKSRNGVYINDDRIDEKSPLSTGDRLKIGKLLFEVKIRSKSPQTGAETISGSGDTVPSISDSSSIEDSVSDWLFEAGELKPAEKKLSTDTRQFKLDETDHISLEDSAQNDTQRIDADQESVDQEIADQEGDELESSEEEGSDITGKKEKKEPGKLPKKPSVVGENSRDAAEDMLKKFFTRR